MVASTANTAVKDTARWSKRQFVTGLQLAFLLCVFALAFLPSIQWIIGEWAGAAGALSHGYLVAGISIYLIATAVPDIDSMMQEPVWWCLPVLLGLSAVWLLAFAANVAAVETIVLPAILLFAMAASFGIGVARRLAFPILFIYLAMPALTHLKFIFQAITVFADQMLVRMAGISALVEGNFVHVPAGTFEIAGGCSGLNYVVAGLSLAVLYGHLFYTKIRQHVSLILLTLLAAMIGNWIRVFTIILVGYQTEMQSPLIEDHLTLGWFLFAIMMLPVYLLARKWEGHSNDKTFESASNRWNESASRNWLAIVATAAAMFSGPAWAMTFAAPDDRNQAIKIRFPTSSGEWIGPADSHWEWRPLFAGPDAERVVEYRNGGHIVLSYVNIYLSQRQGQELVYFSNDIAGNWKTVKDTGSSVVTVGNSSHGSFIQLRANSYLGDWVIWYRYDIGSKSETSESSAKLSQALETLQGRTLSGAVAFAALCKPSCADAEVRLSQFVSRIGHEIQVDSFRINR